MIKTFQNLILVLIQKNPKDLFFILLICICIFEGYIIHYQWMKDEKDYIDKMDVHKMLYRNMDSLRNIYDRKLFVKDSVYKELLIDHVGMLKSYEKRSDKLENSLQKH